MTFLLKFAIAVLRGIYSVMKLLPAGRKVVFLSRQADVPSSDFLMLDAEIRKDHPEYSTVMLCRFIGPGLFSKIRYGFHLFRQMYHLATARVAVLDSYAILVSVLDHKESLLVIQMWHSVGTMKKFGYSILDMPEGSSSEVAALFRMHANYDYILASSEAYKAHLGEGMNYPVSKIVTLPLPRVELLHDEDFRESVRSKIFAIYPELNSEKKNILYIPTFRKGEDEEALFDKALKELCDAVDYDRYNLIIKVHPLAGTSDPESRALFDRDFSSFDMLFVSDYIISDYSCIIYEAAALGRPLFFYTYDYDTYMETRDIYMDYMKEIPGPALRSAGEVVRAIENDLCSVEKVNEFYRKYVTSQSDHETKDISDFIFSHLK